MLDLHTHSSYSDGSDTPAELAARASEVGLRAISLTDHDSTASFYEMEAACARYDVELISGVEVSVRDTDFPSTRAGHGGLRNVHLLAYFVPLDLEHPLQRSLAALRADRVARNYALVERLNSLGFGRLTIDYLSELAGRTDSIGRPHFARAMFELHPEIVGTYSESRWNRVFTEWLGNGGRAYIPKTSFGLEHFVAAGAQSGVVFSIAHPLVNYIDDVGRGSIPELMRPVLSSLKDRGVLGVEAYYGGNDATTRSLMVELAREVGMIPTGGSDYHGDYKKGVLLGRGRSGDLNVPDEILDELRAAR